MNYYEEIKNLIDRAESGDDLMLDNFIELRKHKSMLESAIKMIKDFEYENINEISDLQEDYPEGYKGFKITRVNGKTGYDFKNIKEWSDTEAKKKAIEGKYKALFGVYQKTNSRPKDDDGNLYDLPEIKYSKSYLKLTEITK